MTAARFLTADWLELLMLNYEVEPAALTPHLPAGCELDTWDGRHFVSVVGFQFLRTRVLGLAIPFHRDFEEVNLRFYVRHRADEGWRRGVVFIKEIVPRRAIAWVARTIYGENYVAHPMRHHRESARESGLAGLGYEWRRGGAWEGMRAMRSGAAYLPAEDSEETFITEHYWGYTARPDGRTGEYQVEHPRWRVWQAEQPELQCDVEQLYGRDFVDALAAAPSSAFIAEGSKVVVRKGRVL